MKLLHIIRTATLVSSLTFPLAFPVAPANAQSKTRAKANLVSKKHKFAVYMPASPKISSRSLKAMGGGTLTSFVTYKQPIVYMAIVMTVSARADSMARANFFDMAQKSWMSNESTPGNVSNMRLIGARDSIINGRRARDLVISCDVLPEGASQPVPASFQLVIFKEGQRIYYFGAAVPMSQRQKYRPQIHQFLGSARVYK